ncbi:MAG TPA: metallophosphoesterase [Candidatus Elarobacter sp.]
MYARRTHGPLPLGGLMIFAAVLSAWLQYAADGKPQARALVTGACPTVTYAGGSVPMHQRAGEDLAHGWNENVCEAAVPAMSTNLIVGEKRLPHPVRRITTLVVTGDTGCRMKGGEQQNCGDPAGWQFPRIARAIARARPDLIVDIGDYLYREDNCPPEIKGCVNYWGDTSAAWAADWFEPAAPLFAVAPLAVARGNHEDCYRAGGGWFRFLEPTEQTACPNPITANDGTPPYPLALDGLRLVIVDSAADASDVTVDPQRAAYYQRSFDAAASLAGSGANRWIVTHRPPYANGNAASVLHAKPADATAFDAVITGHVHDFAAVNVTDYPPMIVNGEGGDDLDDIGATAQYVAANKFAFAKPDPFATKQFGFALYTRTFNGWTISLRDANGVERRTCTLTAHEVSC